MSNKVETIVIFDTAVATDNIGDEIIMESIHKEMNDIFSQYMMLKYSTHTPIMHFFQSLKKSDPQFEYFNKTKYKFIGGSNIFKKRLLCRRADWNINLFDIPFYKNVITIGCGTSFSDGFQIDKYTKWLYSKILSKKYIHSVRDEKTKKFIESIGGKAINTG